MKSEYWASRIESNSIPIPEAGCWIWTGAVGGRYGQIRKDGRAQYAHRVSFEAHKGKIPDGLSVCHVCDEPLCVNPAHLFSGTHSENIKDMHNKGRHNLKKRSGDIFSWSRLTYDQAQEIRQKIAAGKSNNQLAAEYSCSPTVIQKIRSGRTYRKSPQEAPAPK